MAGWWGAGASVRLRSATTSGKAAAHLSLPPPPQPPPLLPLLLLACKEKYFSQAFDAAWKVYHSVHFLMFPVKTK